MKYSDVIETTEFEEFIVSCRDFCNLLESDSKIESLEFLIHVQNLLPRLYQKALTLKTIDLGTNVDFEKKFDKKEYELVENRTLERIGQGQFYWAVFDPVDNKMDKEELICGDLHDDLMDIYKDVRSALTIFELNTTESQEFAVWDFKFLFWHHWGNHAIDAMRAIHYLLEKTEKYK